MNTKTIITQSPIILIIGLVINTHLACSMKPAKPCLPPRKHAIKQPSANNDVFVNSKDPKTTIQVQYATEEYCGALSRCYTVVTTKRMRDYPHGLLCLVKQHSVENPPISFYEPFSHKEVLKIDSTEDFDEFTIHPEENGIIIITKKNDFKKINEAEIARFTLSPHHEQIQSH